MEEKRKELADLAVNEVGALVEIRGRGRILEYDDFGYPRLKFSEKLVNKITECFEVQGWCEESYYQEGDESDYKDQVSSVCFGFNSKYVDPYKGW